MVERATHMLTFVLPTGRVLQDAIALIEAARLPAGGLSSIGRRLVLEDEGFRFILAKPMDVPMYLVSGAADLGLAGSDVLMETGAPLVDLADTGKGVCRMVLAAPCDTSIDVCGASKDASERRPQNGRERPGGVPWIRVATKYPGIADRYFSSRGIQAEIIHLNGSVELAPRLGMSECIVDIVQTGSTLAANGLVERATICPVSLRLVASKRSVVQRQREIRSIREAMTAQGKGVDR